MTIYTEEFMALKIAVGIMESRHDLSDREKMYLEYALSAIQSAEERQNASNARMAAYMKQRRRKA